MEAGDGHGHELCFLLGNTQVMMNLVMSGLWFYVYNELLGFGVCFFFLWVVH